MIPAKGWTHRSVILGSGGYVTPCVIPYQLGIDGDEVTVLKGDFAVDKRKAIQRGIILAKALLWDFIVEEDKIHGQRIVGRPDVDRIMARLIGEEYRLRTNICSGKRP